MPTINQPQQDHIYQVVSDLQKQVADLQNPYRLEIQSTTEEGNATPPFIVGEPWNWPDGTPRITVNVGPSGLLLISLFSYMDTTQTPWAGTIDFGIIAYQDETGWYLDNGDGSRVSPGSPFFYIELSTDIPNAVKASCSGSVLISGVPQGPVVIQTGYKVTSDQLYLSHSTLTAESIGSGGTNWSTPRKIDA